MKFVKSFVCGALAALSVSAGALADYGSPIVFLQGGREELGR